MSRKKSQPKKDIVPDPKFNSTIIPKLINNLMYDGKRGIASKIVYDAIEKIKTKSKDEPINIFNEAINNICLLYTSPSPRDLTTSRMPSSA